MTREFWKSFREHFIIVLPMCVFLGYPIFKYCNFQTGLEFPSWYVTLQPGEPSSDLATGLNSARNLYFSTSSKTPCSIGFTVCSITRLCSANITTFITNTTPRTGMFFYQTWSVGECAYDVRSLVGEIAHPMEFVCNFLLPALIPPLIAGLYSGIHITTLWIWLLFREMRGTEAHSGYVLPWYV